MFSSVLRVSSKDLWVFLHYDVCDNVLIGVRGRKRVVRKNFFFVFYEIIKSKTERLCLNQMKFLICMLTEVLQWVRFIIFVFFSTLFTKKTYIFCPKVSDIDNIHDARFPKYHKAYAKRHECILEEVCCDIFIKNYLENNFLFLKKQ